MYTGEYSFKREVFHDGIISVEMDFGNESRCLYLTDNLVKELKQFIAQEFICTYFYTLPKIKHVITKTIKIDL